MLLGGRAGQGRELRVPGPQPGPTEEQAEGSFMTAYLQVCNSQSLPECGEPQAKGSSRGAGPQIKCGTVEVIRYDSV